jgi:hypothetical protein
VRIVTALAIPPPRPLVTLCVWTRTIQYDGEWLTFEEHRRRRIDWETPPGIRPNQAGKILAAENPTKPTP